MATPSLPTRLVLTVLFASCLAVSECGGVTSKKVDAGPSTPYVGYFRATVGELGAGFASTTSVLFAPPTSVASLCASPATVSGDCCYSPHVLLPPTVALVSAGTLTVSDGSAVVASMMPDSRDQYSGAATPTWNPGDLLHVTGAGGVVHPFEGSVRVPGPFVATPGTGGGVIVDRTKDFVTTWTTDARSGEIVSLYLVASLGTPSINCMAGDEAGEITIPAQLLANAQAGATVITNVYRSANATVTGDNATVYLAASSLITWNGTVQ